MSHRSCHLHRSLHPTVSFSNWDILCTYVRVTLYYCTIHIHATYVHMYMCMHAYKAALKQGVPRLPHCSCSAGILIAGTHVLCKCPSMLIGGAGCSWRHSFECKVRFALYSYFTYIKYGHLGRGNKFPVPSRCITCEIEAL